VHFFFTDIFISGINIVFDSFPVNVKMIEPAIFFIFRRFAPFFHGPSARPCVFWAAGRPQNGLPGF
jgi:hypothetical protein